MNKNILTDTPDDRGEIVVYQPDEVTRLEVRVSDETVWLTQAQMSELFGRERTVITKHIRNIFAEHELDEKSNVQFLHLANSDKPVKTFSLYVIISVGYRVKSLQGTYFRQWANKILKEYLLHCSSVHQYRYLFLLQRIRWIGAKGSEALKKNGSCHDCQDKCECTDVYDRGVFGSYHVSFQPLSYRYI